MTSSNQTALIVIDVQESFRDLDFWGPSANPAAEANIAALIADWREHDRGPVVLVRHDEPVPGSPLHPAHPQNRLQPFLDAVNPELLITKSVNSAFYGEPDLHRWLQDGGISELVLCGIQTNMCVETTARMAGNLGYGVQLPLDATRTFDLVGTVPGLGEVSLSASELMVATALNLHLGEFAQVTTTAAVLQRA